VASDRRERVRERVGRRGIWRVHDPEVERGARGRWHDVYRRFTARKVSKETKKLGGNTGRVKNFVLRTSAFLAFLSCFMKSSEDDTELKRVS
jgi:hypothetical protein